MSRINIDNLKGNEPLLAEAEKSVAEIGGIDFKDGAARFANKRDKYVNSLHKFAITLEGTGMTAFETAVLPENDEETRRIVHTLKGTAGNLSISTVQDAALDFENTIKAGSPDPALYQKLMDACQYVKEQMDRRFTHGEDGETVVTAGGGTAELKAALVKLSEKLEASEAAQVEEICMTIKKIGLADYKTEIDKIAALIDDYDYFSAADEAKALSGKL